VCTPKVLLANFDQASEKCLAKFLERRGYLVTHCPDDPSLSNLFQRHAENFDLAILDFGTESAAAEKCLTSLRNHRTRYGLRPMVLCVLRAFRGPQFELQLERFGARVVYVR
jgi:DNA-binding response OmpR family regulator